jgi:hypothetical protein
MDLEEGVRYTCHGKKISNFQQDNWKFQLIKNLMNLKKKKKKKRKEKKIKKSKIKVQKLLAF